MKLYKLQKIIRADRERQAETHAYYLSLLPKYRKTSIVLPSNVNERQVTRLAA